MLYQSVRHVALLAVAAATAFGSFAHAGLVTVVDPLGNSDFTVTYDDAQAGPFGTPFLSNNTIYFVPNDFSAQSANGDGLGALSDSFAMRLDAITDGFSLDQFDLQEEGDYILNGDDAFVAASGELRVFAADDPGNTFIDALETGPLNMQSPNFETVDWTGSAAIGAADGWTGATSVWVTVENILIANTSEQGSYAFIEKKFEGVAITVSTVPLPPALWLFGAALLTLIRRRG
jgi:hypothetical protein